MVDGTPAMPHHRTRWRFAVLAAALVLVAPTAAPAAEYAFLVGVGKYSTRELRELQYAESDVRALYYALREKGYHPDHIVVLSASAGAKDPRYFPIRKNILDEFDLLIRTLSEQDSLLVALAGHGVQFEGEKDTYFCPADTDLGNRETLISLEKLYADLDLRCKATNKVLLVDACRNDPQTALSRSSRPTVKLESVTRPQALALPRSLAAFYSCSPGQEAFEHPDYQQGLFFYHVVAGLKGAADLNKDGIVTLSELGDYVIPAVQTSARVKLRKLQTPELLNVRGVVRITPPAPLPVPPPEPPRPALGTITNSIGIQLAFIPAGEFQMGSPESDSGAYDDEKPQHTVRITTPFYLGVTEVTQEQYERVMGSNPSEFKGAQLPVETVSWEDATEFCRKLSELSAEQGAGRVYRLPTEAEWEYACRAGSKTKYSFGDSESSLGDYAWYISNSDRKTNPVGQKKPNAWGLYDMHGNVREWCSDWWKRDYTSTAVSDPTGPATGSSRVIRGGGWLDVAGDCRSAARDGSAPAYRHGNFGFRLAFSSVDQSGR
jgi:formylglycine-generating enzyme required for sulfatase activity